jgi:hypothetical protein
MDMKLEGVCVLVSVSVVNVRTFHSRHQHSWAYTYNNPALIYSTVINTISSALCVSAAHVQAGPAPPAPSGTPTAHAVTCLPPNTQAFIHVTMASKRTRCSSHHHLLATSRLHTKYCAPCVSAARMQAGPVPPAPSSTQAQHAHYASLSAGNTCMHVFTL